MSADIPVLQVHQAIAFFNSLLQDLELQVEGEVANFSVSRQKFVFFDLKDEKEEARLSCFMMAYQLSQPLEDGMRVVVHGRAGLYQKNGQFRISVLKVTAIGEGSLKRAFELLRLKLQQEGLFAPERKRILPRFVEKIAIISSSQAAGFGDFQRIAWQRLPGVHFTLFDVMVQGNDAEEEICAAFYHVNTYHQFDAVVLIRGGGSLEDLHAFNSELVARAVAGSKFPVLVGVGHERDITIVDYVADIRAATPSHAAQILLPTIDEVIQLVAQRVLEGRRQIERIISKERQRSVSQLSRQKTSLAHYVATTRQRTALQIERQRSIVHLSLNNYQQRLKSLQSSINALSPHSTMERGFSLTLGKDGKTIRATTATLGEEMVTYVADGHIKSVVATAVINQLDP